MSTHKVVIADCADPKKGYYTLGELQRFLDECRRAGAEDQDTVLITGTVRLHVPQPSDDSDG